MALTGALHAIGPAGAPPLPPLNLVGDFGGGGMLVVTGILAALVERQASGRGQIIDAAMIDGVALLMTQIASWRAMNFWTAERGSNLLDGTAYFYRCYETADGRYIAVGALEPQFHDELIRGLGLDVKDFPDYLDRRHWPLRSQQLEQIFRTRDRDAWVDAFAGLDACVSPVLTLDEAPSHPANVERALFDAPRLGASPSPAPRLSRTALAAGVVPMPAGKGGSAALHDWGVGEDEQVRLRDGGHLRTD
jgi:alpha-methylacyl-CoA racemase